MDGPSGRSPNTVANGKAGVCHCDTLTEGYDIATEVTAAYCANKWKFIRNFPVARVERQQRRELKYGYEVNVG